MVRLFDIAESEAAARINAHWRGRRFTADDEVDALTHEIPDDMARFIYYVAGTKWWVPGEKLEVRQLDSDSSR